MRCGCILRSSSLYPIAPGSTGATVQYFPTVHVPQSVVGFMVVEKEVRI